GDIRTNGMRAPPGPRNATLTATASWPSRNTTADTGTCSPTTALAGRVPPATTRLTEARPRRPATDTPAPRGGVDRSPCTEVSAVGLCARRPLPLRNLAERVEFRVGRRV